LTTIFIYHKYQLDIIFPLSNLYSDDNVNIIIFKIQQWTTILWPLNFTPKHLETHLCSSIILSTKIINLFTVLPFLFSTFTGTQNEYKSFCFQYYRNNWITKSWGKAGKHILWTNWWERFGLGHQGRSRGKKLKFKKNGKRKYSTQWQKFNI